MLILTNKQNNNNNNNINNNFKFIFIYDLFQHGDGQLQNQRLCTNMTKLIYKKNKKITHLYNKYITTGYGLDGPGI